MFPSSKILIFFMFFLTFINAQSTRICGHTRFNVTTGKYQCCGALRCFEQEVTCTADKPFHQALRCCGPLTTCCPHPIPLSCPANQKYISGPDDCVSCGCKFGTNKVTKKMLYK
jgi:hypothetical protein